MDSSKDLTLDFPPLTYATLAKNGDASFEKWKEYPERILQFGTGVLLRGLVGWTVFKANEAGQFRGKIVVVGSTGSGRTQQMNNQQGLFTQRIEGFHQGAEVGEFQLNASISRAISSRDAWEEVLACARNPQIDILISNTTEAGIQYVQEDMFASPPQSFPAKLAAFLYERFQHHPEAPCVILPTELIVDNGKALKELVLRQINDHKLEQAFVDWLHETNYFCNTLVDRIVTGMPNPDKFAGFSQELGYDDQLLTVSEVYKLWAIEGPPHLESRISFVKADEGILLIDDISPFRERKLRILNGSHTITVALGYLYGLETVYDCLTDSLMSDFIERVVHHEIVPSLPDSVPGGAQFASEVLDRFRNPFLGHKLLSITFQYTSKMRFRNLLTFIRYQNKFGKLPRLMTLGVAAFIYFSRPTHTDGGTYYGTHKGTPYVLNDDLAAWWDEQWKTAPQASATSEAVQAWASTVFQDESVWGAEINEATGLAQPVGDFLWQFINKGIAKTLEEALAIE